MPSCGLRRLGRDREQRGAALEGELGADPRLVPGREHGVRAALDDVQRPLHLLSLPRRRQLPARGDDVAQHVEHVVGHGTRTGGGMRRRGDRGAERVGEDAGLDLGVGGLHGDDELERPAHPVLGLGVGVHARCQPDVPASSSTRWPLVVAKPASAFSLARFPAVGSKSHSRSVCACSRKISKPSSSKPGSDQTRCASSWPHQVKPRSLRVHHSSSRVRQWPIVSTISRPGSSVRISQGSPPGRSVPGLLRLLLISFPPQRFAVGQPRHLCHRAADGRLAAGRARSLDAFRSPGVRRRFLRRSRRA